MIKDELNGLSFHGNLKVIESIILNNKGYLIDDITKQPIKIIGIVKNKLGQIGCLLNEDIYILRSVYIDESNNPHLSSCQVGGAMIDNNIDSFNFRTFTDLKTIDYISMF
jgi:hypothetical protein